MSSIRSTISLADVRRMIDKSIAAARALDVTCSVAVIDTTGKLPSFVRQDPACFAGYQESSGFHLAAAPPR